MSGKYEIRRGRNAKFDVFHVPHEGDEEHLGLHKTPDHARAAADTHNQLVAKAIGEAGVTQRLPKPNESMHEVASKPPSESRVVRPGPKPMFDRRPITHLANRMGPSTTAQTQKIPVVKALLAKSWGNAPAPTTTIKKPHGTYSITSRKNNHVVSYGGNGMRSKPIPGGQHKTIEGAHSAVAIHHAERTAMIKTPIR